jgi:hypothetical protein
MRSGVCYPLPDLASSSWHFERRPKRRELVLKIPTRERTILRTRLARSRLPIPLWHIRCMSLLPRAPHRAGPPLFIGR